MVFNAVFTNRIDPKMFPLIVVVFFIHLMSMTVRKWINKFLPDSFSHLSHYLWATMAGGNICFPLYASLVGASYIGNIIVLDIAGIFIIFLIIPILISGNKDKQLRSIKKLSPS